MSHSHDAHTRRAVMLNRRQFLRFTAIGGTATALLAACAVPGQEGAGTGAAPSAGSDAAPAAGGGTTIWMGHQEIAGLGPDDTGPTVQYVLVMNIHDPLVYTNEFTEIEPVLAESYEVAEDGLTYTFKLREGVLFHDGTPLTAQDVKYTYDFYRDPANATSIAGDFTGVDTVDAPDDYTLVVNMASVNAASLSSWAETPIVNSTYHAEVGEDFKGNRGRAAGALVSDGRIHGKAHARVIRGGVPVFDVGGKMMAGFDPETLLHAVRGS